MKRFEIDDDNTGHNLYMQQRQNGDVEVAVWNRGRTYVIGRVVVPESECGTLLNVLRAA